MENGLNCNKISVFSLLPMTGITTWITLEWSCRTRGRVAIATLVWGSTGCRESLHECIENISYCFIRIYSYACAGLSLGCKKVRHIQSRALTSYNRLKTNGFQFSTPHNTVLQQESCRKILHDDSHRLTSMICARRTQAKILRKILLSLYYFRTFYEIWKYPH